MVRSTEYAAVPSNKIVKLRLLTVQSDRANLRRKRQAWERNAMSGPQSNRRTDEQLDAIRFETGEWVVNGPRGEVLCSAASLQRSIDRAADCVVSGANVAAISRVSSANIVIFTRQIERLRQTATVRELLPAG